MTDDQIADLYRRGLRDIERYLAKNAYMLRVANGLKNGTVKRLGNGMFWSVREAELLQPDSPDVPPTP